MQELINGLDLSPYTTKTIEENRQDFKDLIRVNQFNINIGKLNERVRKKFFCEESGEMLCEHILLRSDYTIQVHNWLEDVFAEAILVPIGKLFHKNAIAINLGRTKEEVLEWIKGIIEWLGSGNIGHAVAKIQTTGGEEL